MSQLNQSPVEDEWIRISSIFNIQNLCNCHPTLKPSCRTNSWDPCQQVLHLLLSRFGMFLKQLDHSGFPSELGLCSSQIWNHVKSNTLLFELRVRCGKPTTTGFQHLYKSLSNGNMTYKYHQISSNIHLSIYLSVYLSIYLFIYLSNVSIYHIQYISYSIHVHVCTKCGVSAATRFTKACRLLFEPHKNAETHPHLFTLHEYNIPVDYKKYHSYEVSKYKITINNVRSPRLTIQWIGHVQSRNQRNFPPLQASWLRP